MKTKIYVNNDQFITGMTLKDESEFENNNMALHVCENPKEYNRKSPKISYFLTLQAR